jgi:hypothetical protein
MRTLLTTMALVAMMGTTSYAEIICTPRGCWETHMRIFRNGGAYGHLPYVNHRDTTPDSSFYPKPKKQVRIIREY